MNWQNDVLANAETPAKPQSFHSDHGDCTEAFFGVGPYVGKRLGHLATVYVSEETGQPIGLLVKGAVQQDRAVPIA